MRYFSPHPVIADLRSPALGFVAPVAIPDPRRGRAAAQRFLKLWASWAGARERTLQAWASDLDDLISLRSATCAELSRYNKAALLHWAEEVVMSVKIIKAGASADEVPQPPLPALFAAEVKVVDRGEGRFSILTRLPCKRDAAGRFIDVFPDFSKLAVWGRPQQVEGASTPRGGQAQLGALPALAWVVIAGLLAGAVAFSVDRFVAGWTNEDQTRATKEMQGVAAEQGRERAKFQLNCLREALEAVGPGVTPEQFDKIQAQCIDAAERLIPIPEPKFFPERSIGMGLLLGGLGVAVVVGSFAYFRRQQQK